ncbi:MAG TPA: hypothetical protein VGL38_05040 [bacterium]|jgi:hypothetical protein
MKSFAMVAGLLALVGMGLVGCQEDVTHDLPYRRGCGWYGVQIVMLSPTDTLRFLPGDSASAQGFVVVKDAASGLVEPGVKVNLSLRYPGVGVLECPNDTTNSLGRVDFVFRTNRQPGNGYNIIHVSVGSAEADYKIWIQPVCTLLPVPHIGLSRRLLTLQDSVQVSFTIIDTSGVGVSGVTIPFTATGGYFSPDPFPPTDISGRTVGHWYPTAYGWFIISAPWRNFTAKDSVSVDSTLGLR